MNCDFDQIIGVSVGVIGMVGESSERPMLVKCYRDIHNVMQFEQRDDVYLMYNDLRSRLRDSLLEQVCSLEILLKESISSNP